MAQICARSCCKMSDDSEYEAYNDFADLTEEDFARLDAASALSSPPVTGIPGSSQAPDHAVDHVSAMPSISIEVEGSHASAEEGSPIHRYRRKGTLTVTDLISLAW